MICISILFVILFSNHFGWLNHPMFFGSQKNIVQRRNFWKEKQKNTAPSGQTGLRRYLAAALAYAVLAT
jgi:hypothetical protein